MHIFKIISAHTMITLLCALYVYRHHTVIYQKNHHRFSIVCTTTMIADAVHNIAGKQATVHALMGPGIDPHLYRAKEGDVHRLMNADLVLYHGLHLEGKMSSILEKMSTYIPTIAVTDVIEKKDLIMSDIDGTYDPHLWHDITLWTQVVQHIAQCVMAHDPTHADAYKNNAKHYIKQLHHLEDSIKKKLNSIPTEKRILVTAHDAFSYFGKAYGLHVVGLQGISTQSEIGTRDLQDLSYFIKEKQIAAIFLESSTPARNMQAIQHACKKLNWNVAIGDELFSDSLDSKENPAGTYCGMIKANVDALVKYLK